MDELDTACAFAQTQQRIHLCEAAFETVSTYFTMVDLRSQHLFFLFFESYFEHFELLQSYFENVSLAQHLRLILAKHFPNAMLLNVFDAFV